MPAERQRCIASQSPASAARFSGVSVVATYKSRKNRPMRAPAHRLPASRRNAPSCTFCRSASSHANDNASSHEASAAASSASALSMRCCFAPSTTSDAATPCRRARAIGGQFAPAGALRRDVQRSTRSAPSSGGTAGACASAPRRRSAGACDAPCQRRKTAASRLAGPLPSPSANAPPRGELGTPRARKRAQSPRGPGRKPVPRCCSSCGRSLVRPERKTEPRALPA